MRRRVSLLGGWLFAASLCAAFSTAGFWQLGRAVDKQRTLERSAQVLSRRQPMPLASAHDVARVKQYDWAAGTGRFANAPALLLDNQQRNGRVGVRVYRLFHQDDGGELLVDMGWLPWSREQPLPDVALPSSAGGRALHLRGLLAPPPSSGIALGAAMAAHRSGAAAAAAWLATRIDLATIDARLGDAQRALAPRVLRLDPAVKLGYERDLTLLANTLLPEKHRGYAVQWFGLALATLLTALVLTFRSLRR